MRKFLFIGLMILIIGIACVGLFLSDNNQSQPHETPGNISGDGIQVYSTIYGKITIDMPIPVSPSTMRLYSGYFKEGDLVNEMPGDFIARNNVTSEEEAPEVAIRILEQYGGLPPDAILTGAVTNYRKLLDPQTGEAVDTIPLDTSVSWYRMVDGRPVVGDQDIIQVILGENGELVRIYKRWRTYTPAGDVPVIPFSKATEKLEKGEVLNPYPDIREDVQVYSTILGYYAKGLENPEIILEPVWILYGNATSGSYLSFQIYALQFANFTATPVSGKAPLTVTFTDTSDTSPVKWNWDFGDGTNSEKQNPAHTYTNTGTYNVTLEVSNDIGSDTISKQIISS